MKLLTVKQLAIVIVSALIIVFINTSFKRSHSQDLSSLIRYGYRTSVEQIGHISKPVGLEKGTGFCVNFFDEKLKRDIKNKLNYESKKTPLQYRGISGKGLPEFFALERDHGDENKIHIECGVRTSHRQDDFEVVIFSKSFFNSNVKLFTNHPAVLDKFRTDSFEVVSKLITDFSTLRDQINENKNKNIGYLNQTKYYKGDKTVISQILEEQDIDITEFETLDDVEDALDDNDIFGYVDDDLHINLLSQKFDDKGKPYIIYPSGDNSLDIVDYKFAFLRKDVESPHISIDRFDLIKEEINNRIKNSELGESINNLNEVKTLVNKKSGRPQNYDYDQGFFRKFLIPLSSFISSDFHKKLQIHVTIISLMIAVIIFICFAVKYLYETINVSNHSILFQGAENYIDLMNKFVDFLSNILSLFR